MSLRMCLCDRASAGSHVPRALTGLWEPSLPLRPVRLLLMPGSLGRGKQSPFLEEQLPPWLHHEIWSLSWGAVATSLTSESAHKATIPEQTPHFR